MPLPTETTKDTVIRILREQLGFYEEEGSITDTTNIQEDLGADSLDTVELVMAAEEEFNVEITDEDAEKVKTVGDAVELIDHLKS